MIFIQVILVVGFVVFLWFVLANPSSHNIRAWTKILATLFVLLAIVTVIFPNITNTMAHWVGVKRGADLLLYLLTLAFVFAMFSSYLHGKRQERRLVTLARKMALLEANERYKGGK